MGKISASGRLPCFSGIAGNVLIPDTIDQELCCQLPVEAAFFGQLGFEYPDALCLIGSVGAFLPGHARDVFQERCPTAVTIPDHLFCSLNDPGWRHGLIRRGS